MFISGGGAWVGYTSERTQSTSITQRVCTEETKATEVTRVGHFDLKRWLISEVKKPNNAGELM